MNSMGTIAGQQVSNQAGAINNLNSASQGEQGILQNANTAANNANVTMQTNLNNVQAQAASQNSQNQNNLMGGIMSGGGLLSSLAHGGKVKNYDDGGEVTGGDSDLASSQGVQSTQQNTPSFTSSASSASSNGPQAAAPMSGPQVSDPYKSSGSGGGLKSLAALLSQGGEVKHYDQGGGVTNGGNYLGSSGGVQPTPDGPSSAAGKYLSGGNNTSAQGPAPAASGSYITIGNPYADMFGKKKGGAAPAASAPQPAQTSTQTPTTQTPTTQTPNAAQPAAPQASSPDEVSGYIPTTPNASTNNEDILNQPNSSTPSEADTITGMARGGKVPAMVSPGEGYLPPNKVNEIAKQPAGKQNVLAKAEKIPGKAKVKGDSLKNDTVPRDLDEGGIVIPRSIMNDPERHKKAVAFVNRIMRSPKAFGGKL